MERKQKKARFLSVTCYLLLVHLFAACAGTAKTANIELYGNSSVGDMYEITVYPEGVVCQVSGEYSHHGSPMYAGVGGTYVWTFEAIAEGEAEIVVYNRFRGGEPLKVVTYKAVVDGRNNLTLTELERHGDGRPSGF